MEREFKVGDICRIRQWDDMAAEAGIDSFKDYIPVFPGFVEEMRYLCGKTFTIKQIDKFNNSKLYRSKEAIEKAWSIGAFMLEHVYPIPEPDEDFDFTLNLADLLG